MKKQTSKMIIIGIILFTSILVLMVAMNFKLSKHFFEGFLAGLAAIAAIVWLISIIKIYKEIESRDEIFNYPPFRKSLGMFCLFMAILLINSSEKIYISIISVLLFGASIVFGLQGIKKKSKA